MNSLAKLARKQPQWHSASKQSVTPERRALKGRRHTAIVAATGSRSAEAAAGAMREHLRCVDAKPFQNAV